MRHTALQGNVALNEEYEIRAVFPKGDPVCPDDSGGHQHGFHQWLDGDCTKEAPDVRFSRKISIWADYNAAEYSRDEAVQFSCPDAAQRDVMEIGLPPQAGWVVTCNETREADREPILMAFFARKPGADSAFGPDDIAFLYSARLYTDPTHRHADMRLFQHFLASLELAGIHLEVGP